MARRSPGSGDRHAKGGEKGKPVGASSYGRTETKPSIAPPDLKPGHVRCPVCRNGATVTLNGYLRTHTDLWGFPCHNRARGPAEAEDGRRGALLALIEEGDAVERPGLRLPRTGRCHDCDREVSGERLYCGSCLVAHGTV